MSGNGTRSYLTRDAIFGLADRPCDSIQVPEWGDAWVRIATWSLAAQWRITQATLDGDQRGRLLALIAALSLVDEYGQRLFSDADIDRLADEKNYRALQRITQAAMRWNGLDQEAVAALGKASESLPSDASLSVSPPP